MISNSFFPYLELRWVNIYDMSSALRSCRRAVVAIKYRILYSLLLPVVPHFSPAFSFPLFTRCHSRIPHFRFLPIAPSDSRKCRNVQAKYFSTSKAWTRVYTCRLGCPPVSPNTNSTNTISPNPEKVHSLSKCSCFLQTIILRIFDVTKNTAPVAPVPNTGPGYW